MLNRSFGHVVCFRGLHNFSEGYLNYFILKCCRSFLWLKIRENSLCTHTDILVSPSFFFGFNFFFLSYFSIFFCCISSNCELFASKDHVFDEYGFFSSTCRQYSVYVHLVQKPFVNRNENCLHRFFFSSVRFFSHFKCTESNLTNGCWKQIWHWTTISALETIHLLNKLKSKQTKWLFIINRHHLYGWISIELQGSISISVSGVF